MYFFLLLPFLSFSFSLSLDLQKCPVTEEGMILRDGWLFSHEDFIPVSNVMQCNVKECL